MRLVERLKRLEQQHTDNEAIEPTRILWGHEPADHVEYERLTKLGKPALMIYVKDARKPPEVTA